jgi:hypothetical protein
MAQTQLYTKRAQICIKEETTVDTYVGPAGDGSGMFVAEIADSPMTMDSSNYEPNEHRGDSLEMDENPGPASATISFRCRIKGEGVTDATPEFNQALLGCGLRQSVSTGASQYYPFWTFDSANDVGPPITDNPAQSYSVTVLESGVAYAIKGAFGDFTLSGSVGGGEPGFLDFNYTGAYVAPTDDALETTAGYLDISPPPFVGASASMNFGGAVTPKGINSLTFNLGNQISLVRDINDSTGIAGARIVRRKSSLEIDPEMVLPSTSNSNFFALQRAGTSGTFTTGTIGPTQYNRWNLTINRMIWRPPTMVNRDGIRVLQLSAGVSSDWSDVEGTTHPFDITFN